MQPEKDTKNAAPDLPRAQALVAAARAARDRAYAPYSHYPVGAAVLAPDGRIFTGANVENASYGATICAERAAAVQAVSAGVRRFAAVAVISREQIPCLPCGICRQFLAEFCVPDVPIAACRADGTYEIHRLGALMPHTFTFSSGGEEK